MMSNLILDDDFEEIVSFGKDEIKEIRLLRNKANIMIRKVKNGRLLLLALTGLSALTFSITLYMEYQQTQSAIFVILMVSILSLITLGSLTLIFNKKPKTVLLVGGLFTTIISVGLVFYFSVITEAKEIPFFILVIPSFFYDSIKASIDLPKELEKLKKIGVPFQWFVLAAQLKDLPTTKNLR